MLTHESFNSSDVGVVLHEWGDHLGFHVKFDTKIKKIKWDTWGKIMHKLKINLNSIEILSVIQV